MMIYNNIEEITLSHPKHNLLLLKLADLMRETSNINKTVQLSTIRDSSICDIVIELRVSEGLLISAFRYVALQET